MNRIKKTLRYHKGKPNLVVIHPPGTLEDYPFNIPQYRESYLDFFKLAAKNFNVFYVRNKNKYRGQGSFSEGYQFKNNVFQLYKNKIYARIIYNKTTLYANGGRDWDIVNKWNLYKITSDKFRSYQMFKKLMKPTYRIRNKSEFKKKIIKINTDWAVFKPNRGGEGKGIIIGPKLSIIKKVKKFDGIIQEFIDTSDGIPKIINSYHDMRILVMNGRIIQTYIRIPKKGSYLANIARGGKMKEIKKKLVPKSVLKIVKDIDNKFSKYGARIYAVDFGFEHNQPYLVEINPQPGLPYKKWKMYYNTWHSELLKTLLNAIKP